MILQSLVNYYEALAGDGKVTKPGWCEANVSFALDISYEGELLGVIPLTRVEERGKKKVELPQRKKVPQMVSRSSGVSANFLCDNSSYILGVDNKGKPERSIECFQCAKEKHLEILEPVENEIAAAVKAFFEHWNPEEALTSPALVPMKEEILAGGNLLFYVDGVYPQEDFEIKERWKEYLKDSSKAPDGLCMVTGRHSEIARTHGTIKGVQGAQSSGAALVSFNATAFESYGKEQSYNAPVGTYAAFAYTTALNYLLRNRKYFCTIGDTTVVYWAENGLEEYQNVFSAVSEPSVDNQEIVAGVFQNLSSGKAVDVESITTKLQMSQKFFILGLAPNAARIAVRFFYQDSFGNILQHLQQHYRRMEIVKPLTDTMENLPGFGFN